MTGNLVSVLLVEDDDLDVEAFRRALRRHEVDVDLVIARDGAEGLSTLRERARQASESDRIVFLDLNMPGMNGHEFLAELRADPELSKTIVFVLTSSDHDRDIRLAYEKNVAGYFLKSEMDEFIATFSRYVATVVLPPQMA